MQLVYAEHEDGTIVVAEHLAKKVNKKAIVAKPVDMHAHAPLYPGYTGELLHKLYPGAPILTYYDPYPEWKFYQPQTYKFHDVYKMVKSGTRGTVAGVIDNYIVSAYHVLATGTFGDYEVPNTPCGYRLLSSENIIGHTSYFTEPAHYEKENTFTLDKDIALASHNLPVHDECLMFANGSYEFMKCDVIGVVSAVLGNQVYVAPLREVMPETPVYITGSTSGTVMLKPLGRVTMYALEFKFGSTTLNVTIKRGWVFEGEAKPGDSGAPVFVPH